VTSDLAELAPDSVVRASDYPDDWGTAVVWIEGYLLDHRYAPTLRELAGAMGWPSLSTAHRVLHAMRAHEFVTFEDRASRTLAVTARGRRLIGGRARDIIEGISETSPRG
jgi:SOS-response transcriptional repressor LexA